VPDVRRISQRSNRRGRGAAGFAGRARTNPRTASLAGSTPPTWNRALVFFSGLLVLVTFLQLWTFILNQRGFLIVDNVRFHSKDPTVSDQTLFLKVRNPGKTVATTNAVNMSAVVTVGKALPFDPVYRKTLDYAHSIAPGDEVKFQLMIANPEIFTPETINSLIKGDISLHVFGFVKYDNGYNLLGLFGSSEVGYCFTYLPPSEQDAAEATFVACENPKFNYTREFPWAFWAETKN
jgi:hypothetical protein